MQPLIERMFRNTVEGCMNRVAWRGSVHVRPHDTGIPPDAMHDDGEGNIL